MRALSKLLAAILFAGVTSSAQVARYVGAGIGANGLGFGSPYYNVDAGIDWGQLRPLFFEAEAGADTANPTPLKDGYTVRGHGVVMAKATQHWRLGGGVHFSNLFSSKYDKRSIWPTVGAMFEKDWFRLNAQCLIPSTPDELVGPLFDMRMHLRKRFYFRERVGIYWYVSNEARPARRANAVADFGVLYVFH